MWLRGRQNIAYRSRWAERFGLLTLSSQFKAKPIIWLHAVSVGETLAATPLIKALLAEQKNYHLLITSTTPTGSDRVRQLFANEIEQQKLVNVFLPFDLPWFMSALIKRSEPKLCIIMETELWPNLLASCQHAGIKTILANARLSEKSAKGYGKFSALTQPMLKRLTTIAAQHNNDAQRFLALGCNNEQVQVSGNIKFDVAINQQHQQAGIALREAWGSHRPVLTLASSHQGEDEIILNSFQQLKQQVPDLLLMIIPRHPERFDQVAELIKQQSWSLARQTQQDSIDSNTDVFLADTMGQMLLLLAASDLVVMGGSLIKHGGHNPLEACALQKPVVIGENYFNFVAVVDQLVAEQAIKVCSNAELTVQLLQLLKNPEQRNKIALAGKQVVEANQGVVDRLSTIISAHLDKG